MRLDRAGMFSLAIAVLATLAMIACHDESRETGLEVRLVPIPNATVPMPGVLSGGQPTEAQIESAVERGYRTVINLRTAQEAGFEWERELVESSGMRYVHLPVAGGDGLTRENVEALDAALAEARAEGPVLLHCGSGNRIGAMLALRAAWIEGSDPDTALRYGLSTGLTGLEPKTRELLGLATE
jgi:uncharacterized protein (TIGR01244 family)